MEIYKKQIGTKIKNVEKLQNEYLFCLEIFQKFRISSKSHKKNVGKGLFKKKLKLSKISTQKKNKQILRKSEQKIQNAEPIFFFWTSRIAWKKWAKSEFRRKVRKVCRMLKIGRKIA